jgi:hypothetical protein
VEGAAPATAGGFDRCCGGGFDGAGGGAAVEGAGPTRSVSTVVNGRERLGVPD